MPWRVAALFQLGMMKCCAPTTPRRSCRPGSWPSTAACSGRSRPSTTSAPTTPGGSTAQPRPCRWPAPPSSSPAPCACRNAPSAPARCSRCSRPPRTSSTARPRRPRYAGAPTASRRRVAAAPGSSRWCAWSSPSWSTTCRARPTSWRPGCARCCSEPRSSRHCPTWAPRPWSTPRSAGKPSGRSAATRSPRFRPTAAPSPGPTPSRPAGPVVVTRPPPCSPRATRRSPACPGGDGCCGPSCSSAPSPTAGAIPCPPCAPTSPSTSTPATSCSPAPAVTCSVAPAPRPRARARAPSWRPGCAPTGSRRASPRCWGSSRRASPTPRSPSGCSSRPRTVDTHVANLLAKTGARARTQLRVWAGEPR